MAIDVDLEGLANQFDQAIDALDDALRSCPAELWGASMWHVPRTDPWVWPKAGTDPIPERTDESIQVFSAFWTVAYHCLWFLDFYVATDMTSHESPDYVRGGSQEAPWASDGAAPIPGEPFPRDVLVSYCGYGRERLHERLSAVTDEELLEVCPPRHPHAGKTLLELLNVNLEHVREHGQQMQDFLESRS